MKTQLVPMKCDSVGKSELFIMLNQRSTVFLSAKTDARKGQQSPLELQLLTQKDSHFFGAPNRGYCFLSIITHLMGAK